ncbi:hypothetical protein LCGC14_1055500 [marine sediment metagenome]|uniref:Uncharacterized protein n=1 Tax=marine sediment metagenome TaxID=412755 RepID=A0A0F9MMM9_9ZZZZ
MAKQNNTILWIIGIVIIFLVFTNSSFTKKEDFVALKVHYYDQSGNEINMQENEVEIKSETKNFFKDLISSINIFAIGDFINFWGFASANDDAEGITTNGVNIWVVDDTDFDVYKYTMSGSYLGRWSLNSGQDNPQGITTNGVNIWVVDDTPGGESVFKYTMSGSYINRWLLRDASEVNGRPTGITTDGSSIWITDYYNGVFKYTMSGSFVNRWFLQSPNIQPDGITTDGNYIWVVDNTNDRAFKYFKNGAFVDSWILQSSNVNPTGITFDGNRFLVSDESSSNEGAFVYDGPCQQDTCSSIGKQCGTWGDSCGGTITCGPCQAGSTCDAGGMCLLTPTFISFEITATNTGDVPFKNLAPSSANPIEFWTVLDKTIYNLPIGGFQTWVSGQIEIKPEWDATTVFSVCISGEDIFTNQTITKCNSVSGVV